MNRNDTKLASRVPVRCTLNSHHWCSVLYYKNLLLCELDLLGIIQANTLTSSGESSFRDARITGSPYVFTMLRNPSQHLVSMFKHCAESGDHSYGHEIVQNTPFRSWIHYWADVARHFNGSFEGSIAIASYHQLQHEIRKGPFMCYVL